MRTFAPCKGFFVFVFVVVVVFSSLENYFGFRTANVRVKTFRQSEEEENVLNISKEVCIFLITVHSICELILCPVLRLLSPG